ncbi:MAG: DUF3467 domain-containing protein [Pseudomonadota bacterium]
MSGNDAERQADDAKGAKKAQVKLDTSQLKSSYCNVSNVTSTREEVVINFGINQNWDLGQKEMDVELLHRIILSPHAAKRLQLMMTKLLQEYETRYGALT